MQIPTRDHLVCLHTFCILEQCQPRELVDLRIDPSDDTIAGLDAADSDRRQQGCPNPDRGLQRIATADQRVILRARPPTLTTAQEGSIFLLQRLLLDQREQTVARSQQNAPTRLSIRSIANLFCESRHKQQDRERDHQNASDYIINPRNNRFAGRSNDLQDDPREYLRPRTTTTKITASSPKLVHKLPRLDVMVFFTGRKYYSRVRPY